MASLNGKQGPSFTLAKAMLAEVGVELRIETPNRCYVVTTDGAFDGPEEGRFHDILDALCHGLQRCTPEVESNIAWATIVEARYSGTRRKNRQGNLDPEPVCDNQQERDAYCNIDWMKIDKAITDDIGDFLKTVERKYQKTIAEGEQS